jgi:hypothetical protein
MVPSFLSIPRASVCAAAVLFPLLAFSASPDPFPTPGLYRISSDATVNYKGGTGHLKQDDSGAVLSTQGFGQGPQTRAFAGSGPNAFCMPARAANGGLPLPNSSCRGGPGVVGPNGTTFTASCGFVDMTTLVRRIDDKTFEYKVTSVEHSGSAAGNMPDFALQRKMFESEAQNGATAEERAEAAETLKNWAA